MDTKLDQRKPGWPYMSGYRIEKTSTDGPYTTYVLHGYGGSGHAVMKCAGIIPGIDMSYDTLDCDSCFQKASAPPGYMQISYCRKGSCEVVMNDNQICFLSEGDLCMTIPEKNRMIASRIPSGRYEGLTIIIETKVAQKELDKHFSFADIDLESLKQKLFTDRNIFFLRSRSEINHIFYEVDKAEESMRNSYLPLKIVELLVLLDNVMLEKEDSIPQFSRTVVERTRRCYSFLVKNPTLKTTSKSLAEKYNLAETSLRECFKNIYGQPMGAFKKNLRIKYAASLLEQNPLMQISDAAAMCGYENQSKFASAFKAIMGSSPALYRSKFCNDKIDDESD